MQAIKYSLNDVEQMGYEQLGAINDPSELTRTGGSTSPMILRYIVRTGQLKERFPDTDFITLLMSIGFAVSRLEHTHQILLKIIDGNRDTDADNYLDNIQSNVLQIIDIVTNKLEENLSYDRIKNDLALLKIEEIILARKT
jgi:hypothetical protein